MGILDFLVPGLGTIAGGVMGAIGGSRQKAMQEDQKRRDMLINRFSPLSGQRVNETQVTADPVSSAMAGGFQGFKLGQGIMDANFTKNLQNKLLGAAEKGDATAFTNLKQLAEPVAPTVAPGFGTSGVAPFGATANMQQVGLQQPEGLMGTAFDAVSPSRFTPRFT